MRDVDGRGTDAAMKTLKLFTRGGAELGVEVGERLVEKKDGRFADDGAGQSDPLPLTTGKLPRLAIEERANAKERRRPFDLFLVEFFLYVLGLQRKRNIFVHREMRIERITLEDHGDAAFARRKIVDDLAADENFAGCGSFQPGDHPQKRRFSRSRGP